METSENTGKQGGKFHMRKRITYQLILAIFLLGLLIVSCSSATSQPTTTSSNLVDPVFSATSPPALELTNDASGKSTQTPTPSVTLTQTSTPSATLTQTSETCPPFILDSSLPDPNLPKNYIGYHYDINDLPIGLTYIGGSLVSDPNNYRNELGISKLGSKFEWHENSQLHWLERLICHDESGYPYSEIVDAFATPPLSGNETEPWVCFDGETEVHFVGGLGIYDESVPKVTIGEFQGWPYTEIVFLYDVDFAAQQFVLLDVDNLICLEGGRP
jgi:hypothetical protein